jgi:hypothetical protein
MDASSFSSVARTEEAALVDSTTTTLLEHQDYKSSPLKHKPISFFSCFREETDNMYIRIEWQNR